jgi:cytoskeleton protein RodZ
MGEQQRETTLGPGARLRSARKAQALSVEQVARDLRLDEGVLRALEDERYSVLGAPIYIRGHLRSYARLLGISEESVLNAYQAAHPDSAAVPEVTRDSESPISITPGPGTVALVSGVALLAIFGFWLSTDDPVPVTPAAPGGVTVSSAVALPPANLSPVAAQPATMAVGDAGEATTPTDAVAGTAAAEVTPRADAPDAAPGLPAGAEANAGLVLEFIEASWVEIRDRNGELLQGEQPAGSRRQLRGVPPYQLSIGNRAGVRILVDGAVFEIPERASLAGSNVARFRIDGPAGPAPAAAE